MSSYGVISGPYIRTRNNTAYGHFSCIVRFEQMALRKKCPIPLFRLNTEIYSVNLRIQFKCEIRIQSEYGKIQTRNTPHMLHIVWSTAQKWSFLLRIFSTVFNSGKSHFAISDIFASSYQLIITSFPILEHFYANCFKHCFKHCYVATIAAVLKSQTKSLKANETRKRGL